MNYFTFKVKRLLILLRIAFYFLFKKQYYWKKIKNKYLETMFYILFYKLTNLIKSFTTYNSLTNIYQSII